MKKAIKKLFRKKGADHLVLSFPKCGRTWLRMMLNKIIIDEYNVKDGDLLETYKLTRDMKEVPNIQFLHDDDPHIKQSKDIETDKSKYTNKKVIFLIRDPRDTLVSYYFQYTKRGDKEDAKDNFNGTMSEFMHHNTGSIDSFIKFYNVWANNRTVPNNFFIVRYEDLMNDPIYNMQRVLDFLEIPAKLETIKNAVDFCNFDNMKKMEKTGNYGNRLSAGKTNDPESFKVRKGKVGGYTEYLTDEDIKFLDNKINKELDDYYYYYKSN